MKKILSLVLVLCSLLVMTGCNKQVFDLNYDFNYAVLKLPTGEIVEGTVQSWTDYEDGDQLQVTIEDTIYLTNAVNCTLMYIPDKGPHSMNKQLIDLTYSFNYGMIKLADGSVIEGTVESWKDYDGEQLQVKINGVTYLTNSFSCVLMYKYM